ncbi:MAG: FAD:protein FMN transferase [Treponema sp.]|jgi:thiamine biosynthesis lipoprotein|nr:FAD:protein FMN transferase [Treponema sp.]
MRFKNIPVIIFFPWAVYALSCSRPAAAQTEFVMGTVCSVNLYEGGSRGLYAAVFSRLREIDRAMNANGEEGAGESEVARINRNAGKEPVRVSGDLIAVLDRALRYAELSGGGFDPTVGPLVKLWGIGTERERVPPAEEITAALALVNWRDVRIDHQGGTVFLTKPGMAIDLGAIAKGYAADETGALVKKAGLDRGIIDLGGNILALGSRPGAGPWRIGIQDPERERGTYLGVLPVRDKSVVTSGVYERYFESGGRRYHHILSTGDGYPVDNGLLAVTIMADFSIDADSLSTSVFTLGYEKGRALVESIPGAEAIFVFADKSIRGTQGAMEIFSLASGQYRIED